MKTKHTPGPWEQMNGNISGNYLDICEMYQYIGLHEESEAEANAKLIAEAPELLEALHNLINAASGDAIKNLKIALADAKATIKKATE